jgi:hypothetical protein
MFEYHLADHPSQPGSDADPDDAGFSFLGVASRLHRVSGLHHQLSRFIEKYLSGLRQRDAPLISQKEGHAQIFLELADLTAQRRLRDVQLLRRLAEVQVFRDSDKVANVPKFHGALFYTR